MEKNEQKMLAGQHFADDLRRIREEREVSLNAVHRSTLVTQDMLNAFEQTALFDHHNYSLVYIRHLVRAYARAISVAPEDAINALEEAFTGRYRGQLAAKYLNEELQSLPSSGEDKSRKWRSDRWRTFPLSHSNSGRITSSA